MVLMELLWTFLTKFFTKKNYQKTFWESGNGENLVRFAPHSITVRNVIAILPWHLLLLEKSVGTGPPLTASLSFIKSSEIDCLDLDALKEVKKQKSMDFLKVFWDRFIMMLGDVYVLYSISISFPVSEQGRIQKYGKPFKEYEKSIVGPSRTREKIGKKTDRYHLKLRIEL